MKSINTILFKSISLLLVIVFSSQMLSTREVNGASPLANANDDNYVFRILEVQPTENYELNTLNNRSNVVVDQMQMSEFIGLRLDLLDLYDVVYIGNKEKDGYTYLGQTQTDKLAHAALSTGTKSNQGTPAPKEYGSLPQYEYKVANDITNLKAAQIISYANAGGKVYIDSKNFASPVIFKNTKLYQNFSTYYDNSSPKIIDFTSDSVKDIGDIVKLTTTFTAAGGHLKPSFILKERPIQFNGDSSTYITANVINYRYDILSSNNTEDLFTIRLYFDIDGDGYYEADEMVDERVHVEANNDLLTTISLPDDFMGVQPWKLQVINESTGASSSKMGYAAFVNSSRLVDVNVLQIYPNRNFFDLSKHLVDGKNNSLLNISSSGYNIKVDMIHINEFNKLYENLDFSIIDYKNVDGKGYDMIIIGFSDTYGHSDIASERIADDIKDYIATGQSVMFTHDTVVFRYMYGTNGKNASNWSANITRYLRDTVGQNIFVHDQEPVEGSLVHGFSDYLQKVGDGTYSRWADTREVKRFNDGVLTEFPYKLPETLTVATTHTQWFQLDLEDPEILVWYTLKGTNLKDDDPRSYYYTYSKGNVTYSGTGHVNMSNTGNYDERRLFVNTMVKAIRGSNLAPSVKLSGITDGEIIAKTRESLTLGVLATDPNINDHKLVGRVYVDYNNDGILTDDEIVKEYTQADPLFNGQEAEVEIDLTQIAATVNTLNIKVIVYDGLSYGEGAKGEASLTNPIKEIPVIDVTKPVANMMVGETQTIPIKLELSPITDNMAGTLSAIQLSEKIYKINDTNVEMLNLKSDHLVIEPSNQLAGHPDPDHMNAHFNDVLTIVPSQTWSKSMNYTVAAKEKGTYDLKTSVGYDYHLGSSSSNENRALDRQMKVYKGFVNIALSDNTGAPVVKDIDAKIIRVKDIKGNSVTRTEIGTMSITALKNYVFGEDETEILTSGYYVVETQATDGYSGTTSDEFLIQPTDTGYFKDLSMVITSKPIANVTLTHMAKDTAHDGTYVLDPSVTLNTRYLVDKVVASEDKSVGYWSINLEVLLRTKSFTLGLKPTTPLGNTPLGISLVKVLDPNGVDVTSKFTLNGLKLKGEDLVLGLDEGHYTLILKSKLPATGIKHGDNYFMTIENDIDITMNDNHSKFNIAQPNVLKFYIFVELLKNIL